MPSLKYIVVRVAVRYLELTEVAIFTCTSGIPTVYDFVELVATVYLVCYLL